MVHASLISGDATLTNSIIPQDEIQSFYDEDLIVDVLFAVKSGKEATVYCAVAHPDEPDPYYALKHYRPMAYRAFRNDSVYQEGRFAHESRAVRAMRSKSRKGRQFQFDGWLNHEFATLQLLFAAKVDVPRPVAVGTHGLLLEFIGDGTTAAPMLGAARLERAEAEPFLERLLDNMATMLTHHVVHGDLSAYNILVHQGRPVIIDFPQAVDARVNPNARMLLTRDVANVCQAFTRYGVAVDAAAIADDLWNRYENARL